MEYRELGVTGLKASVVGLGTWVIGGWMWGGAEDRESLAAIRRAIELGVNLIDTAPIYGHGRSEELVGRAVAESGQRDRLILATKVGLEWDEARTRVWRNSGRARILREVEESLRRLRTGVIDLYQVHWPNPATPFEETMETLVAVQRQGKIRFIGLSNFTQAQVEQCRAVGPVHVLQPPFNLFERAAQETGLLDFCQTRRIGALIYSPLCRGLLSGKYRGTETFTEGDVRRLDPKFQGERFRDYVACTDRLATVAKRRGKTVGQLAVRWCLDQRGVTVALCGARRPEQIEENVGAADWRLTAEEQQEINRIVAEAVPTPVGPEFMGPP
ncbi:MAG: aldo/keto reductase [Nitrospirota bacterium]